MVASLLTVFALSQAVEAHAIELHAQVQLTALVSAPDVDQFGGVELQVNASIFGIGVAAGLAWEQLAASGLQSGLLHLAFQFRPVAWLDADTFHVIDPHLDGGLLLGGGSRDGEGVFRGAGYVGAGLDIALGPRDGHAVLTAQYRFHYAQGPSDVPGHILLLGLGLRYAD